jgi:hypothetical protein
VPRPRTALTRACAYGLTTPSAPDPQVPLTDVTQPIVHLAQAGAIVVGGTWAYVKFLRGRTFRDRAHVEVKASLFMRDAEPVIFAAVSMRNEGLGRITFRDREQRIVFVDGVTTERWSSRANVFWDEERPMMSTPLFERHAWVEPGETIKEELLIPVPLPEDGDMAVAYQVRAWIRIPRRGGRKGMTWTANAIVPASPLEVRAGASSAEGTAQGSSR